MPRNKAPAIVDPDLETAGKIAAPCKVPTINASLKEISEIPLVPLVFILSATQRSVPVIRNPQPTVEPVRAISSKSMRWSPYY
ncbi:hypothetical protein N752_05775 [Desulforamulus aquiferis]|nr:hypothetical protein N752_05775 [Desulforamulus aquiferis]